MEALEIMSVFDCLTMIQSELKAPKNQFNSFGKYNYRNCEDIQEAVKPLLAKYGASLVLTDEIKSVLDIPYVQATATFQYASEVIEVSAQAGIDIHRKGMDVSQCFGASSSYARKYCLTGLFLLDDTKDADATNTHGKDNKDTGILTQPIRLTKLSDEDVDRAISSGKMMVVLEGVGVKYSITEEQRSRLENALNNI